MVAFSSKPKKRHYHFISFHFKLCTTVFLMLLLVVPLMFMLQASTTSFLCTPFASSELRSWSGDLRKAEFAWNRLPFTPDEPPLITLKIAVFSRKWPIGTIPGGMERHAYTLHTALTGRGHQVHVFTSPVNDQDHNLEYTSPSSNSPRIHCHEGEAGKWRYNKAWELFDEENQRQPFDVVHSESVALPYWLARNLTNLAVSWHGIALESVQSSIYQDLIRKPDEPMSPAFNSSVYGVIPKILNEIRFFHNYAHHVATSDSCGEMLRDVYQIPRKRVHVILNGVDENNFANKLSIGLQFRSQIGVPINGSLVLGVAGRLVKDKGHPLLYEAFSKLISKQPEPDVYLLVVGSGPWGQRYKELGPRVKVLGSMTSSQLNLFYNAIDIFVNPTLRPQGIDITMTEAMVSGKPLMASRFPSIKGSLVVNDELGFMFSPNVDSLLETLEEVVTQGPTRLAQMGKACQEYAASMFTATKMALAYERLFLCIKNHTFCFYP